MKKKSNKLSLDSEKELMSLLSEELARGVDKAIIDSFFEINEKDNIEIIEKVFPGKDIQSLCEALGVKDLKMEYNLTEKIRDWKINKIIS